MKLRKAIVCWPVNVYKYKSLWSRVLLLWAPALATASGRKPILRNTAWSFQAGQPFNTQTAEDKEEPLHFIFSSTESVQGSASKYEFQAETKKLLDIVARSLHSEKELFASHALEKLRHKLVSDGQALPEMEIHLQTDAEKGTITIQDTAGVQPRTIARPGSKAFLDALQNQAEASSKIIGQFKVGFYWSFMVADRVEVYSRSASPGSPGYQWLSDGSGVFEIAEASGVRTGTKIIHLKSDCREFANEARVQDVVTKYSNFVSFPLYLSGRWMNTLQDISEWQHEEFNCYIEQAYEKPCYTLHYKTVTPLNIRSILFVPDTKPSVFDVSRELGSSVALYSLKVLIQTKATDILPKWLCFIRVVVDSEDIPLNLSWELQQEGALIRKLRDVLQQRLIKFLVEQSKKDAEKYANLFIMREGIVTMAEQEVKEDIAKLLRYESSALPAGQLTSLLEYANRMRAGTRNIYYLCAPNWHLAEHSPYYKALTLLHLREFDKKQLISVETDTIVDHYKEEKFKDGSPAAERLSEKETEDFMAWMRNMLGSRVTNVKQLARNQAERAQLLQPALEINPRHALMKLNQLQLLVDQIYENVMIAAGLIDDPRAVVGRLNELLVKALE
uniref:Histidine kinase/HSP90-like ATPase domain-containing protein n=1 Tax=Aotus nancymaae TaxID=37293 RepID=A0A2K5F8F8_AOTNA